MDPPLILFRVIVGNDWRHYHESRMCQGSDACGGERNSMLSLLDVFIIESAQTFSFPFRTTLKTGTFQKYMKRQVLVNDSYL